MSTQRELPRVLGLVDIIGILVGTVIGSGIFIVPATVATEVHAPTLMMAVWVVGGVLSFFGALAFAELGAMYPQAGGMYVYLREAYGPFVAFLFGWTLFLVIDSGAIATLSMAFSSKYLTYFVALSPRGIKAVALVFIAVLVAVNYRGTRQGAMLQNILTIIKFGAILGVSAIVLGLGSGNSAHFVSPPAGAFSGGLVSAFGVALVATLWAYKGWEATTFSAGELRNPQRNLPLGLLAGSLLVIVLYLLANVAYLWVLPAERIATSSRVAADAMQAAVGGVGAGIVAFVILFSITGAANGNVLTAPRVFYAMARDGIFFERFGRVHDRYLTPHVSILATGIWAAVLSLSGTFEQLAAYVIFGQWIFFGLTVGAVMILRRTRPGATRPYRTWGYPVTPVVFIAAALFISLNSLVAQPANAVTGLAIILLGAPAYLYWRRKQRVTRSAPTG
ncbi:MAG TPA: amino acid permease [Vicinamibacterales bacterium]|nr:amino acid permease [Vicinamibacterales bacterium]